MSNRLTLADAINEALDTGKEATFIYEGTLYTFSAAGLLTFLADNFNVAPLIDATNITPAGVSTGALTATGPIVMTLPTSDPAVAGQLWSNVGVVTVSAG